MCMYASNSYLPFKFEGLQKDHQKNTCSNDTLVSSTILLSIKMFLERFLID